MSCTPSGATPTASTTQSGGERSCPLPVRGDPSWRESPMESRRGEKSGQRTILGPDRMGFSNRRTPSRRTLSRTPRSRAIGLEGVQTKPRPRLYHRYPAPAALDACLDRMSAPILPRREEPDTNMLCPQSTFQELPVMGKEYASSRSLVTTSPRIWCEARAWRELSELQSCDWAVQLA